MTIDSWRDSFSPIGEFRQPPSAVSVMSQSEEIMSYRRAALDREDNLWQPCADGRQVKCTEPSKCTFPQSFFLLSFALHATMRLRPVKEDVQPSRSKVCLFWVWWIRSLYLISILFISSLHPILFLTSFSSTLLPLSSFLPLSLSIMCFPVNSSETVLRTQTEVNKV